jgi:flagellar protein FlaG
MEKLTRALQATQRSLSFSVDENTGKTIVRVVSSTGELVRQIPSEEALAIAASLAEGDGLTSLGLDRWS